MGNGGGGRSFHELCDSEGSAVVLERIVSVDFIASWEPPVDILQYLLVLQRRLFLERGEEDWPRDKLLSVDCPLEFLVDIFQKTGSRVRCMKEGRNRSREELICWPR